MDYKNLIINNKQTVILVLGMALFLMISILFFIPSGSKTVVPNENSNQQTNTHSGITNTSKTDTYSEKTSGISKEYVNALKSNDILNCSKLSDGKRKSCELELIKGFSEKECSSITDTPLSNYCKDLKIMDTALNTRISSSCSFIKDKNKRMECYSFLSGINACKLLIGENKTACEDRYHYEQAIENLKLASCNEIINKTTKTDCIKTVSKSLHN